MGGCILQTYDKYLESMTSTSKGTPISDKPASAWNVPSGKLT